MMPTNPPALTLSVQLDYYRGHKQLLSQGSYLVLGTAAKVEAFREHNTIAVPDFLNYFLIHRAKSPSYATYLDRLSYVGRAAGWLEGVVDINGTINCHPGSEGMQEQVGEAISLSVASKLFDLTQADWIKIPEQQGTGAHPTFDFERTLVGITEGNAVIQIEAKGTFVADNTKSQPNVRTHAANIRRKKEAITEAGDNYRHPATALYGMIASIDPLNTAKCWLLDPPPIRFDGAPRNIKIANRLDYVSELTEMLAPNAQLPKALGLSAKNWRYDLSRNSRVEGLPYTPTNYIENYLATNKVLLDDLDVVGEVYVAEADEPFFFGLKGEMIRVAIRQDPDEIARLSFPPSIDTRTISAQPRHIETWGKNKLRRLKFDLFTSSSGVVIGLRSGRLKRADT
jgi:hypothetical protein